MVFANSIYVFTVISSVACGDLFGVDETLYNQLRSKKTTDEIASEFMENLFPKLIDNMFPKGLVLPPVEVDLDMEEVTSEFEEEGYTCATETELSVSDIKQRKGEGPGWAASEDTTTDRIVIAVDLDVKYSELQFELAQNKKGSIIPKTPVKYEFEGENVIRLIFSIPNFPQKDVKNPKCLVQMWHLTVIKLGTLRLLNEDEIKKLGDKKMEMVEDYGKKIVEETTILIGIGMFKAVTEKLRNNDSWVCVTRSMIDSVREDEKEYKRKESSNFKKYCGGGGSK